MYVYIQVYPKNQPGTSQATSFDELSALSELNFPVKVHTRGEINLSVVTVVYINQISQWRH